MSEHRISVTPVDGGWSLACEGETQPQLFLSGRCAEAQARALALALSRAGDEAFVYIHDRTDALIGATRYSAADARKLASA
ncbi:hypothetical protein [Phenylobacterium sp.]|jgi:hypothetical protein|uniref:hypothetical protein n=1 Tax=Phenylobacterium sp. TaxID=1871053 RepID=UPI002F9218A3